MLYPWLQMAVIAGAYLAMFAIGEIARGRSADAERTRKFSHVAAGGLALTLPLLFSDSWPVLVLAVGFVLFLLVTGRVGWLGSVHGIARRSAGAFLYPIAVATCFVVAADDYASYAVAVLALAIGDAAGGIAGSRWAGHPYSAWGQRKTLEGSLAVFGSVAATAGIVLALAGRPFTEIVLTCVFVGFVVMLTEGALPWGLDNLGVPFVTLASLGAAASAPAAGAIILGVAVLFGLAVTASRRGTRDDPGSPAEAGVPPGVP